MDAKFLYIYRGDEPLPYTVSEVPETYGAPAAIRGRFQTAKDAQTFAYAVQAQTGMMVHVLPSAEIGPDLTAILGSQPFRVARDLCGEESMSNPEYVRACAEMVCDLTGTSMDAKEQIIAALVAPKG